MRYSSKSWKYAIKSFKHVFFNKLKQSNKYLPFAIQVEVFGGFTADADVVFWIGHFFDADIPWAWRDHDDLLVAGCGTLFIEYSFNGVANIAGTFADAADVFFGGRIYNPITANSLKVTAINKNMYVF